MQDDRSSYDAGAGESGSESAGDLARTLGRNLRRIRTRNGLSLDKLSLVSGVSRAMLGQIENGKSVPSITVVWKVATALGIPFATLTAFPGDRDISVLRRDNAKILMSSYGRFTSRALFPYDADRRSEFYEIRLAGRHLEQAEAHAPGTRENIVVATGTVEVAIANHRSVTLSDGDAVEFAADSVHSYKNLSSTEAVLYLVMTYSFEQK